MEKLCHFCNTTYNYKSKQSTTAHKKNCKEAKKYKQEVFTKEYIELEYIINGRSAQEIASEHGFSAGTIIRYVNLFGFKSRNISQSNNDYIKNKRKQTNIKLYGEEHNFSKNHPSRIKWEKRLFKNEGITNVRQRQAVIDKVIQHGLETKYRLGLAIRPELFEDNIKYKRKVQKLTEQNYKINLDQINPNRLLRKRNEYQLDHIVSINYGFRNNIPVEIIAHTANLQMLTEYENISKGLKCDITIDELYKRIEQYEYCENKINKED